MPPETTEYTCRVRNWERGKPSEGKHEPVLMTVRLRPPQTRAALKDPRPEHNLFGEKVRVRRFAYFGPRFEAACSLGERFLHLGQLIH